MSSCTSLNDQAERRAALMAEPVWRDFLEQIVPFLQTQESKILLPTAFSLIGGTRYGKQLTG